ncbi:MAG: hypothetical protein OHK0046_30470 [Anaerolineae bacterium]
MSALEREIIEKFHQLSLEAKQRVLDSLKQDTGSEVAASAMFDCDAWKAQVDALQAQFHVRLGQGATAGTLSLLRELREEES